MEQLPQQLSDKPTKKRDRLKKGWTKLSLKPIIYLTIASATVLLVVWAFRPAPIPVDTGRVQRGSLQVTVDAEGKTRVRDRFTISAPVNGRLDRIVLNEGDSVQPGTAIARIDPLPLNAAVREALGRLAEWKAQRTGVATLRPKTEQLAQARSRIDAAEAAQRQAEARIAQAQARLAQAEAELTQAQAQFHRTKAQLAQAAAQIEQAQSRQREAQARSQEVQAELAEAQLDRGRMARLRAEGAVSQSRLDAANTKVASLQARLQQAIAGIEQADRAIEEAKANAEQTQADIAQAQAGIDRSRSQIQQAQAEKKQATLAVEAAASEVEVARAALSVLQAEQQDPDYLLKVYDARIASVEAELTKLRDEAARTDIRSPGDGQVLRVIQKSAQFVSEGTPLLEVGDPTNLEIVIDVLSTDAANVKPGNQISIDRENNTQPLRARVRLVEPSAFTKVSALGVEEQRINVIGDFVDLPQTLGDGYRLDTHIVIWQGQEVLKVPLSALFRCQDRWCVFVVQNDRARRKSVEVGHRSNFEAEILQGLAPGEVAILHPSDRLEDGKQVQPQ